MKNIFSYSVFLVIHLSQISKNKLHRRKMMNKENSGENSSILTSTVQYVSTFTRGVEHLSLDLTNLDLRCQTNTWMKQNEF